MPPKKTPIVPSWEVSRPPELSLKARPTRSDAYQWKILEVTFSNEMLELDYHQRQLFSSLEMSPEYLEALLLLEDQLRSAINQLIDQHLTVQQRDIYLLLQQGYTQCEVAKILGARQTTVTKSLFGNLDYNRRSNHQKTRYGGVQKKLIRLIRQSPECLALLKKIYDQLDPDLTLFLPYYFAARACCGTYVEFEKLMEAQ